VKAFADQYGYPIAIKAAFGGGGRGLKVVRDQQELARRYESAVSEAISAFGRGECYVERFVERPRHVEAQIIGDGRGRIVVAGTRDCSVQRRHQKIVEEAPAPFLTKSQRDAIVAASIAIGQAVEYRGVGTMEFMLGQDGELSFLEVNTRIQVEHPVTERTTGLDLVALQFRIAEGGNLNDLPDAVPADGHAFEFRLTAEDPGRGFLPQAGQITRFDTPGGPGVRVEAGVASGGKVPAQFDSMVAKIICWGQTREEALARSRQALKETRVEGLPTLIGFHRRLLEDPAFAAATAHDFTIHTGWLENDCDWLDQLKQSLPRQVGATRVLRQFLEVDGRWIKLGLPAELLGQQAAGFGQASGTGGGQEATAGDIRAPMTGILSRWLANDGDQVAAGDPIAILEAMKMETRIVAERSGVLTRSVAEDGATVSDGQVIGRID
ncbi:MAG: ATP-grasp domain-containing protein, partial [Propionibacteriaceae bacterium]|nr:ATP-grasp domain-containing protein [Propionibacteriaceae bacterium]